MAPGDISHYRIESLLGGGMGVTGVVSSCFVRPPGDIVLVKGVK